MYLVNKKELSFFFCCDLKFKKLPETIYELKCNLHKLKIFINTRTSGNLEIFFSSQFKHKMINVLSYFFLTVLGISSLCIVLLQNTFFALLFLILSFLLTSIILFFLECEFLALILIIIYVGAVAILLLFVLMMLETKLKNLSKDMMLYFPFGVFINGVFFMELVHLVSKSFNTNSYLNSFSFNSYLNWYHNLDSLIDIEVYGQLLYTQFVLQLLIVGLVLFLALMGVIFLTIQPVYKSYKSQTSFCQLSRSYLEQNSNQILL